MCTTLTAISLVVYMEARNQSDITKQYIASFVIEKAEKLKITTCKSLKIKNLYSWNWDSINTPIDRKVMEEEIEPIVKKELSLSKRSLSGYEFFNICKGKKFTGKVKRSGSICFYKVK